MPRGQVIAFRSVRMCYGHMQSKTLTSCEFPRIEGKRNQPNHHQQISDPQIKEQESRRDRGRTEEGEKSEAEGEARAGGEGGIDGAVEDCGGGDGGGEKHLGGEDAIDFADEPPSELVVASGEPRVDRPRLDVAAGGGALFHPLVAVHSSSSSS